MRARAGRGRRIARRLALGALGAPLLLLGAAWLWLISPPPVALEPLDPGLIPLTSAEGARMLEESGSRDAAPLRSAFQAQLRRSWCGVASIATVLTAFGQPLDQHGVFTDEARTVRGPVATTAGGMTLAQLSRLLSAHGRPTALQHAGASDVAAFRAQLRAEFADPGDLLLVNYHRAGVGQEGGGHISPIAAWHEATDRVLILDVAAHRYPPVWVPTAQLFAAMNTVDSASGETRGWVSVE